VANDRPLRPDDRLPVVVGTRWPSIQSRWPSRGSRWGQTTVQEWLLGADGRPLTPNGRSSL
ncbi:unnamed protein product, partial [Sphenostylis stenocarpa]